MSSVVRIGVVAEGTTDHLILEQILASQLHPKDILYTALQPELSSAFAALESELGLGWGGVFKWARQVRSEGGGALSGSIAANSFDILAVHLDCDVSLAKYADIGVTNIPDDLPCEMPCSPITQTIEKLECVALGWLGETSTPANLVFCIPAWATEGWVLAALYPDDPDVILNRTDCLRDPVARLSAKPASGRLVSSGKKRVNVYRNRAHEVATRWQDVVASAESAKRFDSALRLSASRFP